MYVGGNLYHRGSAKGIPSKSGRRSPSIYTVALQYVTSAAMEETLARGPRVAASRGIAVEANHQSLCFNRVSILPKICSDEQLGIQICVRLFTSSTVMVLLPCFQLAQSGDGIPGITWFVGGRPIVLDMLTVRAAAPGGSIMLFSNLWFRFGGRLRCHSAVG